MNKLPAKIQKDLDKATETVHAIEALEEQISGALTQIQVLNQGLEEYRKKLKDAFAAEGIEKYSQSGVNQAGDKISLSYYQNVRMVFDGNVDDLDEEYVEEEEIDHIVKRGGKYYLRRANLDKAKEMYKLMPESVPEDFKAKLTPVLRLTINNKKIN